MEVSNIQKTPADEARTSEAELVLVVGEAPLPALVQA